MLCYVKLLLRIKTQIFENWGNSYSYFVWKGDLGIKGTVSRKFLLAIINRKMHFCLSKLLTGRGNGSQKGITGREFCSQNHSPDVNLVLITTYKTRIWPSNIFCCQCLVCLCLHRFYRQERRETCLFLTLHS